MSGTKTVDVNALLSNPAIAEVMKKELGADEFAKLETSLYGQLSVSDAKKMLATFDKEQSLLILLRAVHLMLGYQPTIDEMEEELEESSQALGVFKALPAYEDKQLLGLAKSIFGLDCFKMRKTKKSAEAGATADSYNPLN